jgi:hypothetical protein
VKDDDKARIGAAGCVLAGHSDREVVVTVAVEVAPGEGGAEMVAPLIEFDAIRRLAEDLSRQDGARPQVRVEADRGVTIDDGDGAAIDDAAQVLGRVADGDIVVQVAVEVLRSCDRGAQGKQSSHVQARARIGSN